MPARRARRCATGETERDRLTVLFDEHGYTTLDRAAVEDRHLLDESGHRPVNRSEAGRRPG